MNENDFEFLNDVNDADLVTMSDDELNRKIADDQLQELKDRYGEDDTCRPEKLREINNTMKNILDYN